MAKLPTADEAFGLPTADEAFGAEPQTFQVGINEAATAPDPNKPLPPSKGLLERFSDGVERWAKFDKIDAFAKGAAEGFGSEPLGVSEETAKAFRDIGIFNDPAKGQSSPIRLLNEAVIRPAAVGLDAVARTINAGVTGIGEVFGGAVGAVTGDETEGERAKREAINLQNFLLLTEGGVNPITRAERLPNGAVHDVQIGGLPTLADFDNAATVLKSDAAKPAMRQLYDERGITPAEIVHDAQGDVTILQDLAAGVVPKSYGGAKVERVTAADVEAAATAEEKIGLLARLEDQGPASRDTGGAAEMDLLHGFAKEKGFSGFKPLGEVPDEIRYDGGGGVFGNYTYLDPSGKWVKGEQGALGHDAAVRVKARFEKLFVLTPENFDALAREVGVEALRSGRSTAEALKAKGYDGIQTKGFDKLSNEGMNALADRLTEKFGASKVDDGFGHIDEYGNFDSSIFQDQVVAFYPERSLSVERVVPIPERPGPDATPEQREAYFAAKDKVVDDEVATFGQANRKRLVAGDNRPSRALPPSRPERADVPAAGGGGGKGGGGEPPSGGPAALPGGEPQKALPSPDEPLTTRQAQDAMLERISVGEHDKGRKVTFQTLYTQFIDDLNPVHEAVKEALANIHPTRIAEAKKAVADAEKAVAEAATPEARTTAQVILNTERAKVARTINPTVNPYELFRLTRGLAGKADQMIKHGTYNALSLKTNGIPLEEVLKPLQEKAPAGELDLMQQFRAYTTAKRTVELAERGVETGMPLEAAKQIVGDAKQIERFEKIHRAAVDYQNRLSLYLRDAGLISPKAYEAMLEANKNYTPFYRYFGDVTILPNGRVGRTLSSRNPLHKITGSDAPIVDPVESMIKNTYTYIALAEKNMAGVALVDLLKLADEGGIWRVDMLAPEVAAKAPAGKGGPRLAAPEQAKLEGPRPGLIEGEVIPPQSVVERAWSEVPGQVKQERGLVKREPQKAGDTVIDAEFSEVFDRDLRATITGLAREAEGEAITVYRDGKKETYRVSDPELLAAWRGLDAETVGVLTKILSVPASTLRAGATLVPDFALKNIVRDFLGAFVTTKGALFSPIDTARGFVGVAKKDLDFQNWLKGGGANAALVSIDRRYLQENLLRLGKETKLAEGAWNVITSPLQGLRLISELTENATRLGEFKKAIREAGGTATKENIQAAAFRSREVTLDFARVGSQMRSYNMIDAFLNAQIQGTDRIIRAFHDAPLSTSSRVAIGITVPSLLLWAYNRDDKVYQDLPGWQRDLFWVFPVHRWGDSTKAEADRRAIPDHLRRTTSDGRFQIDDPVIFRLPKPFETGIIFGSGVERAAEAFFEKNPKAFAGFLKSVGDALVPNLTPTVALPIYEQIANKKAFTGAPLIPDRLEKELPEYRYTQNTSELSKAIGRVVGAFPGMRDAARDEGHPMNGLASALTTPILVENYIRDWTGGLGMHALNAADLAARKLGIVDDPTKPTSTLADIPFVRSFIVRYPSAQVQVIQDFYQRNKANQEVAASLKSRAQAGDAEAVERLKTLDEGQLVALDGIQKAMGAQQKMIRTIYEIGAHDAKELKKDPKYKPTFTPQEMRQHIDALYFQMIQSARGGIQILDAVEKAAEEARAKRALVEAAAAAKQ